MKTVGCTCSDPREKICETHKTYKVTWWEMFEIRTKAAVFGYLAWLRWRIAFGILGDLWFKTGFTCPGCGEVFCHSRELEEK